MLETGVHEFCSAWRAGQVCLHPSDTLPGLSFDPRQERAWQSLLGVKQRPSDRSPLAMIADWDLARRYWQDLAPHWWQVLAELWPGPLSVIWKASELCPPHLLAPDGSCALRWPRLRDPWMLAVLKELGEAFPTSSVNRSGESACRDWPEALRWVKSRGASVYIPPMTVVKYSGASRPSTLIRIIDSQQYEIVREGALETSRIAEVVQAHVRNP